MLEENNGNAKQPVKEIVNVVIWDTHVYCYETWQPHNNPFHSPQIGRSV